MHIHSLRATWSGPHLPPRFLIPQGNPCTGPGSPHQTRRVTMSPDSAIERILELSAETQIKRREAAEDSPVFHNLTGAIVAYGKALGLLSKLKEVQTGLYSTN